MVNEDKPWWFGSKAGVSQDVPPPWTPLSVEEKGNSIEVSPWGRRYTFGPFAFPDQLESRGSSLLAGPMRIVARVDGRVQEWRGQSITLQEQSPSRVVFEQRAVSSLLVLSARTQVEYDGVVRIDWRLEPRRTATLDELIFEIPLKKEHARYFCHFPMKWGVPDAGALPEEAVAIDEPLLGLDRKPYGNLVGFQPFIWLGDEERGLAWFSESDKNWYASEVEDWYGNEKEAGKVTEIIPEADKVTLRLHLVSIPLRLSPQGRSSERDWMVGPWQGPLANLTYTFGLQATPVRPVTKDVWDYRITHLDRHTCGLSEERPKDSGSDVDRFASLGITDSLLDSYGSLGVRTICLHDGVWTDIQGYFATDYGEDLKRVVKACHQRGIQVLVYLGFHISDHAPEWPHVGEQCIALPMYDGYRPFECPPQPVQSAYTVCYDSIWQDATVAGIARLMDEYEIDGVYLDGTANPWGCSNRVHDCGYFRPGGNIALTYPFFAVRNLMRRIYTVVKERKPDGQVNVHNSTCMTIPTLTFATSIWDGEQFGKNFEPGTFALDALPLDAFRTEFMGRQWGVPTELLWRRGAPSSRAEAYAFALLHDVLIREGYENTPAGMDPVVALELESRLWKLSDEFGRKNATWLPYWRNKEYVTATPDGAYVSLYRHPENGVLAVISNLGRDEAAVDVQLDLDKLGLGAEISVSDALGNEPIEMKDGKIQLSMPSLGWKLVWLK